MEKEKFDFKMLLIPGSGSLGDRVDCERERNDLEARGFYGHRTSFSLSRQIEKSGNNKKQARESE
jgi:hypothetical protein